MTEPNSDANQVGDYSIANWTVRTDNCERK